MNYPPRFKTGIILILVVSLAIASASEIPGADYADPDEDIHAIAAAAVLTSAPAGSKTPAEVPIQVLTAKVTTQPAGGVLILESVPPGASVYIDGTLKGITPLTVRSLTTGPHTVTFKKTRYQDYTTTTTVTALAVGKVSATLVPVTTKTLTIMTSTATPGATRIPVTVRIPVSYQATVPAIIPAAVRTTLQPVSTPSTARCVRHFYTGSGDTGPVKDGRLTCTIIVSTGDGVASLSVPEGTLVIGAGMTPVPMIHITPVIPGEIVSGILPDGTQWTGHAYHFLPDSASFDPPIPVSFTLGRNEWERSDPANLTLMGSGGDLQDWESLPTQVDPSTRTISAPVRHFSIIGLFSRSPSSGLTVEQQTSIADLIRTATQSGHGALPLSPVIPDAYAPLAAVAAGIALSAVAVSSTGSMLLSRFWDYIIDLVGQFLGSEVTDLMNVAEIEKRDIRPAKDLSSIIMGISLREIAVIGLTALGFAFAFILQDRLELQLTTVLICILAGGITTILHDLAQKYSALRAGCITEYQFWGLGTGTMLLTAWLFGNAFAKPSRNIIWSGRPLSAEEAAVIRLAGAIVNLGVAVIFLFLIPLGGIFVIAGSAGFTINLMNAVFSLVPIHPNDGVEIYEWNKVIWAAVFFPLIGFYLYIYTCL